MAKALPKYIRSAIKSGYIPSDLESWKTKDINDLTAGESVLRFAMDFLVFPEGKMIGKPLILDPFQCAFILAVFDSPTHVSKGILSMARRGGKTLIMAVILLSYVVGGNARQNTIIRSSAMTREQAGLLYRLMSLTLAMSPELEGLYRIVPSSKKIIGLSKNVEYQSLSRDVKSGHGQAIYVLVVDECGQIDAPNDDYLDMLFSSLGTYDDSRAFLISTQAPNDMAFLSVEIDTATRDTPENIVCHLYCAPTDDIMDEAGWHQANPALFGGYRSLDDLRNMAKEAERIPSKQNGFLNLAMNRRVSLESLWLAPSIWKENSGEPDPMLLKTKEVHLGLDLSRLDDLTACVASVMDDDGNVHVFPYVFTPKDTVEDRAKRDRAPYVEWIKSDKLIAVSGRVLDYEWVAQYMNQELEESNIASLSFDRWRIDDFKRDSERVGFSSRIGQWQEVGQGFKDMSPRLEKVMELLLQGKIRHGGHPLLNMSAGNAIAVSDPANNIKLSKNRATQKIDPMIALVMSVYSCVNVDSEIDIDAMIF